MIQCWNPTGSLPGPWILLEDRTSLGNSPQTKVSRNLIGAITYFSVVKSIRNFAQVMAVSLPCSVPNFRMVWWLKWMLWMNKILRYFNSRCILDGWAILKRYWPYNLLLSCQIILKLCTGHGIMTTMLCAKFQNGLTTEIDVMVEQDFAIF